MKRVPAFLFIFLLFGLAAAASAATTAPAPLTVAQVPSVYAQKNIAPNLFLLLDDSGSMQFEYLGNRFSNVDSDYPLNDLDYGYPTGSSHPYGGNNYCSGANSDSGCGSNNLQYVPGFDEGNMYAAQYRASYLNPNYYNPAITYTPWACADSYPESKDDATDVSSPISGFDCHWDNSVGLWVMPPAAAATAYLNPAKISAGFRDIEVWNDSGDEDNETESNGFAGNDGGTFWYLRYDPSGNDCNPRDDGYYHCKGLVAFWPATYFNYSGPIPGSNSNYRDTDNYQRVQICPATATTNSNGVSSDGKCTPPDSLPASPLPYHTYVDGSGNYVYVEGDGTKVTRNPAAEMQNFANWYQYYRSHILLADAGIGIAFMQVPTGFRVDYGVINTMDNDNNGAEIKSTEDFTSGYRLAFLQKLYAQPIPPQGTPDRKALQGVGEWFKTGAQAGVAPWGNSAAEAENNSAPLACRANYVILATDGQWSGPSPTVGNVDDTTGPSIPATAGHAGYQYEPAHPYQDDDSDTLADVAMKYWYSDIQPSMDNDVPTNSSDLAFWQHLVTFTVGLGVSPSLVDDYMANHPNATAASAQAAVFQELVDGVPSWPPASSHQIDDTWHAAVDGHGTFASASDPTALYKAISNALVNIVNRIGAASSLSVNTEKAGQTRTRVQVFQALFHPVNWWGDVLALPLVTTQASGSATSTVALSSVADWSVSCVLTGGACPQMGTTASGQATHTVTAQSPSSRTILSWNGSAGVAFGTSTLSAAELSTLGPAAATAAKVVAYVRGDRSNEGSLRVRTSVMADVVRASPVFVGAPGAGYPNLWVNLLNTSASPAENESGAQKYGAFISAEANRKNVVYAGANDGMLHAFYAPSSTTATDPGKELMAYVPAAVIPNLRDYTNTTYAHHYFVNATPGVGDLFYDDVWHTWLVGGEGAGGDSIFALNITDPADFSESNPGNTVIHEWNHGNICTQSVGTCNGNDLGLTFGTPVIARFNNGKWGFVFGNGFNSASGVASIFIGLVDSTGSVKFYELPTGYGPSNDPQGKKRPDGIAFVTAVDLNGDYSTDYVYAGDYFGNVWRFNLTSSDPATWAAGYAGGGGPMFTAKNGNGSDQPITTKLLVVAVPGASGFPRVMVEFGTGADVTDVQQAPNLTAAGVQSLYGVWDWDFSQWNSGTPSTGVNARTPVAFQYAKRDRTQGPGLLARANLQAQSITNEQTTNTIQGGSNNNRIVSQNAVCWVDATACATNDKYGWYLDLVSVGAGNQGEKVVYSPVLRSGVFLVNTTIPNTASALSCQTEAVNGWTMALDPENGGRLPFETFDTRGNQKFEEITINGELTPTSGITLGAVGSPGFVTYDGQTYLVVNTGSGEARVALTNLGTGNLAVQLSWQELR